MSSSKRSILVSGARVNTLKSLSCSIPHDALTVVTGPSGSGKSSLAFDTLYAEGQRRFVESMSTYARQFLDRIEKPDVDKIQHILPAIALEQRNSVKNARSTVGTATEIDDYLRVLMATVGKTFCDSCGSEIIPATPESVEANLARLPQRNKLLLLAPLPAFPDKSPQDVLDSVVSVLNSKGYSRLEQNGEVLDAREIHTADRLDLSQPVSVVIDRLMIKQTPTESLRRLESIRQGFMLARELGGTARLILHNLTTGDQQTVSQARECLTCNKTFPEPTPNLFSFNNPVGACPSCEGFGRVIGLDLDKVIPNKTLSLRDGTIHPFTTPANQDMYEWLLEEAPKHQVRLDVPFNKLTDREKAFVIDGNGGKSPHGKKYPGIRGFFEWLETKKYKVHVRVMLARYRDYTVCPACHGGRLKADALNIRLLGMNWQDLENTPISELLPWFEALSSELTSHELEITQRLRQEITRRLQYLENVGLQYLTLSRQARTLSGGESQRIHLSGALGCALTDTLYVLDEPTVGLHARDTQRLLGILKALRNHGNTVVVVEHDPEMILGADHILDMGPEGGEAGGRLLYEGDLAGLLIHTFSPTALSLRSRSKASFSPNLNRNEKVAEGRMRGQAEGITIVGARGNNLKNLTVTLPANQLVCVTGVSGSGKSTLIKQTLFAGYSRQRGEALTLELAPCERIEGLEQFREVVMVDQSPPGRSARSNPVTYVKAYDEIRNLFGASTKSKVLGLTPGDFSFNTVGGRCETCEGLGTVTIDMQFMADVTVVCDKCQGKRFKPMVLGVEWYGRNINDVLNMTVDDAMEFFKTAPKVRDKLLPLQRLGLGYLRLGQSTSTLSGGEAQRLKLAVYLKDPAKAPARYQSSKTGANQPVLFLFDEPTTGLHLRDIDRLVGVLRTLLDAGHSLIVVEHNLDFIAQADHIIDMGPEGGEGGGQIVIQGTVQQVMECHDSPTGQYLAKAMAG